MLHLLLFLVSRVTRLPPVEEKKSYRGELLTAADRCKKKWGKVYTILWFFMVNIDNNAFLSHEELLEASKVLPDMQLLNFTYKQLENLVDGLLAIGDKDGDKRLSFAGMTTTKMNY